MENNINEVIKLKVEEFKEGLSNKPDSEKRLFHYNSVINISNRIVFYNDKKAIELKEKLINYFHEIEEMNYIIETKYKSSTLFSNYFLPCLFYLYDKEKFLASSDLRLFIIIGFITDLVLYYFVSGYYYPVFILLFSIFGYYKRINAKKEGKYAAMFW